MEKFQEKVCVLLCWALMVTYNTAERQYFIQNNSMTWNDARNYCKACFTDLVTLSHDNIKMIVKNLSSQHWIGLRKSFNSTSSYSGNISMPWSHWSNREPLTFQNWYPGRPLFEPPEVDCCGCSCNDPAATTSSYADVTDPNGTDFITAWETVTENVSVAEDYTNIASSVFTDATFAMTTPTPTLAVTSNGYIEDSCVAMFSFGPWIEKNCLELLPFICYDDHSSRHFEVSVTSITSEGATVSWPLVPGRIDHYHVSVKGDKVLTHNTTNLTHELVNLTAGTCYVVHVFPVKCERNLDSENVNFYTKPNKVENFRVTNVTERSIQVNWSRPAGNLGFYYLWVGSHKLKFTTEGGKVDGLTPGSCYTLTVLSGVNDYSMWSEGCDITVYTKPSTVSNLTASDNTNHSVFLRWEPPEGNFTGFLVKAMNSADDVLFEDEVNQTVCSLTVPELPMGTEITIVVTAWANGSVEGDMATLLTYTAPGPISNLTVITTHRSLTARWTIGEGNYSNFIVELRLDGKQDQPKRSQKEACVTFDDLKTAAKYTVVVYAMSGHLKGSSTAVSNFTLPSPPTNATGTGTKSTITYNWNPPENIANATYLVRLNSDFYDHTWSVNISNQTSYTFSNLISGTKYCFEVSVIGGELISAPATNCDVETEPEERQISLSMLCSSAKPLHCDESATRKRVLKQLHDHFSTLLKKEVFWELVTTEE